jgi:hypothetical protein
MSRTFTLLLSLNLLFAGIHANAQSCGSSGPSACTPAASLSKYGLASSEFPCIIQTVPYNTAMQFKIYSTFAYAGQQSIDSVQISGIANLPCGLCWATNQPNNMFYPNEIGCLNISGTTSDSVGQYPIEFTLNAWTDGNGSPTLVAASLAKDAGIILWMPVIPMPETCPPVDTSTNSPKTKYASCVSGIAQTDGDITALTLGPDPLFSSATLSFNALKNAHYQLRISNLLGNIVSVKELQVNAGRNTALIERNSHAAGIYFMILSDGKNAMTRKFVVAD